MTPNVFSYNATISACEGSRGSHWEQALNLFGTMLKREVEADRILDLFTLGVFFADCTMGFVTMNFTTWENTPWKINMKPENTPLEKEIPMHHFQVLS